MSKKKANELYLGLNGNRKHNCAQAVIAAFMDTFPINEETLAEFASCGGGKAPGGECGALYAAQYILEKFKPEYVDKCKDLFLQAAGSTKCKEIRSLKKIPCVGCVEKAAEILEEIEENGATPLTSRKCK